MYILREATIMLTFSLSLSLYIIMNFSSMIVHLFLFFLKRKLLDQKPNVTKQRNGKHLKTRRK